MSPEQLNELVALANVLEAASKTAANHVTIVDELLGERQTNELEELCNTMLLSSLRVRERVTKERQRGRR